MSFLGLYRDPVVAAVTSRCDWRIVDLVSGKRPVTLYLVVPPSDISRTKPPVRLMLNQIGRRLTEELGNRGHRMLLNQIEKAYGANHSILDNCHVRVAFATNDERTARRVSDALGR
jgi:type IV secretion system protein VirD4